MSTATTTTLTNLLKEFYLPKVQEQLNNDILVFQLLEIDSKNIDLEGLQANVALHTARSGGIGSRDEGDDLPEAGVQSYRKAVYDLKYHYGRIQVSGQVIQKTKSSAGAFLRAYKSELEKIRDDLALDVARQVYSAGDAKIATCGASGPSDVVAVGSAEALSKGFIYVGMFVDIGTVANPTSIASNREVEDVDVAGLTFTISGADVTVTSAAFVFRAGNAKANGHKEMDAGLQKLISTSANTVGGIDASASGSRFWDNQRDSTGGAISLASLMLDANMVYNAGVKSSDLKVLTSPGLVRRLFATGDFKDRVQFVNTTDLNAGFEEISFSAGAGKLRMVADRLHPWGKVHFVPVKHIKVFSPGDWDFLAKDGQPIKWVSNKDAFQSILFRYANLGTDRRNNSLVMSGLTDTGF